MDRSETETVVAEFEIESEDHLLYDPGHYQLVRVDDEPQADGPRDRSDRLTVTEVLLEADAESARKTVYEPRSDGTWLKVEKRRVAGTWHQVGQRVLADVHIDGGVCE